MSPAPKYLTLPTCAVCQGRAWMPAKSIDGWPGHCPCKGAKRITFGALARALGVNRRTLVRVYEGRAKPETCFTVLRRVYGTMLEGQWAHTLTKYMRRAV